MSWILFNYYRMSTIQMCLCALHSDMIQNGCNLDIEAARLHIDRINIYFKSDITSIQSGE